jgi:hypothetical protein
VYLPADAENEPVGLRDASDWLASKLDPIPSCTFSTDMYSYSQQPSISCNSSNNR